MFILRNEQKHLNELRFLKEQEIEGPVFVWGECKKVCGSCEETKKKRHRTYIEVKLAKVSSGMGDNKSMFWLKKDGKLLTLGN